jgi:hypothetical protein
MSTITSAARPSVAVRLRRLTAGSALILFPALLVVQAPIDPTGQGSGAELYAAATEHRGALVTSAVLLIVSGVLMAPAAAAVLHQARDRGAALADAGAVLAVLGGFGHFGIAMFYLFGTSLVGGDRAEMVGFVDRLNGSAVVGLVAFPLIMCFALAVLVLPWAAWRAGAIHWWVPAVTTVAVLVEELSPVRSTAMTVVVLTAVTIAYGALGVRVLRMTDAAWTGVRSARRAPEPVRA